MSEDYPCERGNYHQSGNNDPCSPCGCLVFDLKKIGKIKQVKGARVPEVEEMLTTDVNGESTGIVK